MDLGLNGKAALVGGASKGIGKAVAQALAAEGARVAICARHADSLETAAAEIESATGARPVPIVCDMASYDDIKRTVTRAAQECGRLDILVNNAGGPPTGTFDQLDERYWLHALEQNLLSAVRATREALPYLRRSGAGRIINITSVAVKQPIDGLMLSNAARTAVVAMAKTLSRELAPEGITVNNVCPGNIATQRLISLIEERAARQGVTLEQAVSLEENRVPMHHLGDPEDVANLVAFLASDKARYITGTTIQVDGGSTLALL